MRLQCGIAALKLFWPLLVAGAAAEEVQSAEGTSSCAWAAKHRRIHARFSNINMCLQALRKRELQSWAGGRSAAVNVSGMHAQMAG